MTDDVVFETNRFNLSQRHAHFINADCFGEDLAAWLRARLAERGISAIEPAQEDWGWYIEASFEGRSYLVGVNGYPDPAASDPNQGEWRIIVEPHRSLWDKLRGVRTPATETAFVALIFALVAAEPGFHKARRA